MSVASTYAGAFLKYCLEQKVTDDQIKLAIQDLRTLSEALKSNRLFRAVTSKSIVGPEGKRRALDAVFSLAKTGEYSKKVARVLLENGRLNIVGNVANEIETRLLESKGMLLAEIVSAAPLSGAQLESLKSVFSTHMKKSIDVKVSVDPQILAGLKVKVGGITFDGSLHSQIKKLSEHLVEGIQRF